MNVLQKIKRPLSLFMALVLLLSSMSFSTAANQPIEEGETNFDKVDVVFSGRSLHVFGKNHRSMNFYKAGPGSEAAPTFCIAPGKKLPGGTATRYKKYEAKPGETVPVIGSFERYLPMTIAYEWMIREGNYNDKVRYAVVQVYYWGCVAGHETDWAAQEAAMKKLAGVPETRQAMAYYQEMKEYILKGMEEYHSGANSGLPEWNGKQLIMEANEGSYTLTLDISQCPQLKETTWSFPDGNWSYQISPDGSKILFKYNGASKPGGTVTSGELSGVERRFYAYIFTPGGGYQEQMGRPDASHEPASVSFSVNSVPKTLTREPKLYRHSETFHSHYNVELEKYDAETNQPLEGTVFHVWEDFDAGQVNRNDYEEGSPDGETGQVYLNRMSPKPQASHIAGEITTDQEGRGAYRTERLYHYSKTYCMGHPAPDFLEAPEPAYNEQSGEQANADEIQAVEAENERLRRQWIAEQELCAATCDFHIGNEDERNQSESTEALEAMLQDRDETYEAFIALEYGYQLEEKTARTGYVVHGGHKQDADIESVLVAAAQAGGTARAANPIVREGGRLSYAAAFAEPLRAAARAAYTYALPNGEDMELEERRSVVAVTEDTGRTLRRRRSLPNATESEAGEATPSAASSRRAVLKKASSSATPSNATPSNGSPKGSRIEDLAQEQPIEDYISYEYSVRSVGNASLEPELQPITIMPGTPEPEAGEEPADAAGKPRSRRPRSADEGDGDHIAISLPDFMDDSEDPISTDDYGDAGRILYTFKVWNHRTEGRIHINKRDLELYQEDPDQSYGLTQGDATLEGAVYGLFAAQDIQHPDGKTGVVYRKDDLAAIAATDKRGDASFLTFTEAPGTRLNPDGTIKAPQGDASPASLYQGGTIESAPLGFGTIAYPDLAGENGSPWIGRPLLMGSYYIMEISRSEGYELSVKGINLAGSNRTEGDGAFTMPGAGWAQAVGGLSDHNNMNADGSWNDFMVERFGTEQGYDVTVTGYPRGTRFYRVELTTKKRTVREVTGSSLKPKTDEKGQPVYQKAKGGEYKKDAQGNPIVSAGAGTVPYGETLPYRFRAAGSPGGTAVPEDMSKWGEAIAPDYLKAQANGMLKQLGYREISPSSPWKEVRLTKAVNGEAAQEILDWLTENPFFDCAVVEAVYPKDGGYAARIRYDYSAAQADYPAVYDPASGALYVRKTARVTNGPSDEAGYWIRYEKGGYRLDARTAAIKEKKEIDGPIPFPQAIEPLIQTVCQPVFETYAPGEILLDNQGKPIPELERVYTYAQREEEAEEERLVPVTASYDEEKGLYTFHEDDDTDWTAATQPKQRTYRAVTQEKAITHEGQEMPYNQYLTEIQGAGVSAYAALPKRDAGSYIKEAVLLYPGQREASQDGGTKERPITVLQRAIKQSIKITKDISQASYDGVNTYGALHNDPATALLKLFTGGRQTQGTKLLNQFKFKLYLKANLENICVDDTGAIVSLRADEKGDFGEARPIYLPSGQEGARRLLETKPDGTYDYEKFFAAMYAAAAPANNADQTGEDPAVRQFALDYYDIKAYKEELLRADPDLDPDLAYEKAVERAAGEAAGYLRPFKGLDELLAIRWDRDADGGADKDAATLQCNTRQGQDDYFNHSIPLPYGTYVIVEQLPGNNAKELANRHYRSDYPKEITLPFVPEIHTDGNTGAQEVHDGMGSAYFRYDSTDTPDELMRKYNIRFNEETHVIKARNEDGDFEVYKFGLAERERPGRSLTTDQPYKEAYMDGANEGVEGYYPGYASQSEEGGSRDGVMYESYEPDSGQIEVRDNVPVMAGVRTAVEGKFAPMLVPWSVREPEGSLTPKGAGADFNFRAFAQEDFENKYYSSKLRIEKLDAETGETILQDGAIFKIYAAKRDVQKNGAGSAAGSGSVLFGEAVDEAGNPVVYANGTPVLYPRVDPDNAGRSDLPIRLDKEGIPLYDESQRIIQEDREGNETGIFKAYSTIREVVVNGQVKQETVGYIETYKPLGAGAYVLVEVKAPEGYTKSRPVAFEIYADGTYYYEEKGAGWNKKQSERYEYGVPVAGETNKFQTETVSRIKVKDIPSRMKVYKVENGDALVGNENGLMKMDAWGNTEPGGGLDQRLTLNDAGDGVVYRVTGPKEQLEARGDIRDIAYDSEKKEWFGYGMKRLEAYSERIVEGTEEGLKKQTGVKLLYERDGTYSGKGIRFTVPVSGAGLALYHGVELEKTGKNAYRGVTAHWGNGRVTSITNTYTGERKEIVSVGREPGAAGLTLWDEKEQAREPVKLYFYDLNAIKTEQEEGTGELRVLDAGGNFVCYADAVTGMAYVYDDYGRMIAYLANERGEKELVRSVPVARKEGKKSLYERKKSEDDENGLPIYYREKEQREKEESWVSGSSTDSYGNPEGEGSPHSIERLPFGAYILEETRVPHEKGYVQSPHMGLVLQDTGQEQAYFMQNDFTKVSISKLDVRTRKEIKGAGMALYRAKTDAAGKPLTNADGSYQKGEVYAEWTSGTRYDAAGNPVQDGQGRSEASSVPHWLDHVPIGAYVLEETRVPFEKGYVSSPAVNVEVKETGDVQSVHMEDDYTALEIRKTDKRQDNLLSGESEAYLTLYPAQLDGDGKLVVEEGRPGYEEGNPIFTFRAATYKDGQKAAATGRLTTDPKSGAPVMSYDYDRLTIPNTIQGEYYYTERGTVRIEYLPVGSYVLVETKTPIGYATAAPILITIEDKGQKGMVHQAVMEDIPLSLEVSKAAAAGGKEVNGATLAIYPVDQQGNPSDQPLVIQEPDGQGGYQERKARWVSGLDGAYTKEEQEAGVIPPGFEAGDLKPHILYYIPEGSYILREETTPYGFLQSVDVPFSVIDSQIVQRVEMIDEIPSGKLTLVKTDSEQPQKRIAGVVFELVNQTTGTVCQQVTTDEKGQARFENQPIGSLDEKGNFKPYTYVCREVRPASGYMLTDRPYEFQFQYKDHLTNLVLEEYNPVNDTNRVITEKLLGDTQELLEGVILRIERKEGGTWRPVDEWVTTKQGHVTKGLEAGTYRLSEQKAPEGFHVLAEPIVFSITDGMKEIPKLRMRNYTSIVEVLKTRPSGSLLAGARLQLIRKETGGVIREWTSEEGRGQTFYGLKEGTYLIRELEAPGGYRKGEDKEITVTEDNSEAQVFRYENRVSGGGEGKPPKAEYISFKKTDGAGKALSGAEFTFYDRSGAIIGKSVSNGRGQFRIRKPQNGTYTFRETKAPQGYAINSQFYSFIIDGEAVIRGIYEVENKKLEVPVKKVDAVTGEFLPGARLSIRTRGDSEKIIGEAVTGQDGGLIFEVPSPGIYHISEVEAPQGYRLTENVWEVTVSEDGQVSGNTRIYNFKEMLPVKTMGKITAVYRVKNRFGRGTYRFGGGKDSSVRTGDESPLIQTAAAGILCLAGCIICIRLGFKGKRKNPGAGGKREGGKKHRKGTKRKGMWLILVICLLTGLLVPTKTLAMEKNVDETSEGIIEQEEVFYASGQITYKDMEASELLPQRAWITAKDDATGAEREVVLPLADYTFMNERWINGFQMEIQIAGYGADTYLMGGTLLEGEVYSTEHEEELLALAGLKADSYHIEGARWDGEAYEAEGEMYRNLTVFGKKLVRDCVATYAGMVNREMFKKEGTDGLQEGEKANGELKGQRAVGIVLLLLAVAGTGLYYRRRWLRPLLKPAALLFLAGGICCALSFIKAGIVYERGKRTYEEIEKAAYSKEDQKSESAAQSKENEEGTSGEKNVPAINESWLKTINPDYRMWLSIPGTGIDYPVVQYDDNQYYLNHNFYKDEHIGGSLFVDSSVQPLVTDNTIVYGHNMKDGSMFGSLRKYREEEFYLKHPFVRIFCNGRWMECPVFSCQLRSGTDASPYRKDFSDTEWLTYLESMKEASLYPIDYSFTGGERIITCSTCLGSSQRLVVQVAVPDNTNER